MDAKQRAAVNLENLPWFIADCNPGGREPINVVIAELPRSHAARKTIVEALGAMGLPVGNHPNACYGVDVLKAGESIGRGESSPRSVKERIMDGGEAVVFSADVARKLTEQGVCHPVLDAFTQEQGASHLRRPGTHTGRRQHPGRRWSRGA